MHGNAAGFEEIKKFSTYTFNRKRQRLSDDYLRYLIYLTSRDLSISGLPDIGFEIVELYDMRYTGEYKLPGLPIKDLYNILFECNRNSHNYLVCLIELFRRRVKYERVLESQSFSAPGDLSARALLHFGRIDIEALAHFIIWRKFIFDIDNRAAQEVGYLFENLICRVLGGVSYPANSSPIRSSGNQQEGALGGRQVDCLVGKNVYEIKLRMSIAPSGKQRWQSEMAFPKDVCDSGYTPILIVVDPSSNEKYDQIIKAYKSNGGFVYAGKEFWEHIANIATPEMKLFSDKYLKGPIGDLLESFDMNDSYRTFSIEDHVDHIQYRIGDKSWFDYRVL